MNSPTNQSANDRSADVKPRFGLKVERSSNNDLQIEVWQLHSPATPQIKSPKRIAGLRGRNLELIENRVYKLLERDRIRLADTLLVDDYIDLTEETALRLGLLFRVLAPMRSRENMRQCTVGIEQMAQEESSYWLGMAMHRKHPRRVLMALRALLIEPK